MHLLRRLSLELNTWCIYVLKEVGEIDLPRMYAIGFDLDQRTLDLPNMTVSETLLPAGTSASKTTMR